MGPNTLANIVIPTDTVEIADGGKFAVRGISPEDALGLYYRHTGELSALFDKFAERAKAREEVSAMEVGTAMVSGAPRIMAEIIALAADGDPRDAESFEQLVNVARKLPAGVQMDALQKIGALTFSSDMPAGKFFGLVVQMAQSATAVLQAPQV